MCKRQRGVVLTDRGLRRLEAAIAKAQENEKYGKRFTQAELAERANLSVRTIQKIRQHIVLVDETSIRILFAAFKLELETADFGVPEHAPQEVESPSAFHKRQSTTKVDWGEKLDTRIFFGRADELTTLERWVMTEQCRLVMLLGIGGIGKTSLVAKLTDQIYNQFDYVIWRSLREAPPLDEILVRLVQFLSEQQETELNLPARLGERIIRLLYYLRQHRCLIILDNLESILQAESTGQFRNSYEDYGELFHQIGTAEHQSCLLLTSRECPRELATLAGDRLPVRFWPVTGIDQAAGHELLKAKGLELDEADTQGQELIDRYSGNPQALHLVATAIQREFLGDVNDFLQEEGATVEDVHCLLDQHLTRLAPLERSIFFWLAINRELVDLDELMEDLLPPVTKREVRSALGGLSDRCLIETVSKQFTLQNVIMEFATERFLEQVKQEIIAQQFHLFHTHALIKASAEDYIRANQTRLLLKPISTFIENSRQEIDVILNLVRHHSVWKDGYMPGNLFNLLCQADKDNYSADFSHLTLRQIYLQGMKFSKLNLVYAHLIHVSLTHVFSQKICSINFNSNGTLLATGDVDGNIQLWNTRDRRQVANLQGHTSLCGSVVFSPVDQLLATGSHDTAVRLWDSKQYQCLHIFEGHNKWVTSVAFSPDGRLLATASEDATVRLWDVYKHQCLHTFTFESYWVGKVAFSPNGQLLATRGNNSTVQLWDIGQYQCLNTLNGNSVAFSPNGQLLATSDGHTVQLWDTIEYRCLHIFENQNSDIRSVIFSPNGQLLATSSRHIVQLWDTLEYHCLHIFENQNSDIIRSATFSSNGQLLAISSKYTVQLWDIYEYQYLHTFVDQDSDIRSVEFSPDSQILTTSNGDTTVRLWDVPKRQCINTFAGYGNRILSVAFSPSGQLLASGSDDATVRVWDVQQSRCLQEFTGHRGRISSVAFSPDSKLIATGGRDATIRVWDVHQRQCTKTLTNQDNWVLSVAFSPDGRLLASGSEDNTVRLWDVQQYDCLQELTGHDDWIWSIAFSPDGRLLATGSDDGTVRLWDVYQHQCIHVLKGHRNWVRSVAFSPDSRLLATGSDDATIRLWDIGQKEQLCEFSNFSNWTRSVAFSSDGTLLATSGENERIYLWNIEKRQHKKSLSGKGDRFFSATFHPNQLIVASGNNSGSIRLWNASTDECFAVLQVPRPYEGTDITGVQGLTGAQRASMIALGAVDRASADHPED